MQIHDITKRAQRTDEGLLSSLKAGIAGAKAVGQAAMSPTFGAVTANQGALDAAEKSRQAINKKYGLNIAPNGPQRTAGEVYAGQNQAQAQAQAQTAQVTQQAQQVTQQFTQTQEFDDLSAILPDPGHVLVLKNTGRDNVKYYKNENGKWFSSSAATPKPVELDKARIKWAEGLVDKDQYGQEAVSVAGTKTGLKEAAGFNRAALAKASKKADAMLNNTMLAKKLKINIAQISADPQVKAAVDKAKTDLANASGTTYRTDKNAKAKKQKVAAAFQKYAQTALQGLSKVSQSQGGIGASAMTSNNNQQKAPATQQEKAQVAQTITRKTGQDGAKIVQSAEQDPELKQALSTITKESLNKKLKQALRKSLREDQVRISKDIIVRTAGGNYVKKASDQIWYDPNGVPIDPEKYAAYVKKLDGTPQAQTQYQADANKGMTSSFQGTDKGFKANQAAAPPPPPAAQSAAPQAAPDPLQQMADQQKMAAILRNRDVAGINSMINDTFNQLQNAKIFNTGQEDYLKDRMAALMAMKA